MALIVSTPKHGGVEPVYFNTSVVPGLVLTSHSQNQNKPSRQTEEIEVHLDDLLLQSDDIDIGEWVSVECWSICAFGV